MKKKRHVWSGNECYLAAGKQTGHHSHQNCNLLLLDINTLLQAKPTIDHLKTYMWKFQFVIDRPQSLFNLLPQESQMPSWIGLCLQRNMISLWNKSLWKLSQTWGIAIRTPDANFQWEWNTISLRNKSFPNLRSSNSIKTNQIRRRQCCLQNCYYLEVFKKTQPDYVFSFWLYHLINLFSTYFQLLLKHFFIA